VNIAAARVLDQSDPLAFARARFALPDGITYLDGNSLGAMPRSVPARLADVAGREWGLDLITSWTRNGWIDEPQRVAARIAPLVGAATDEVLVCDSTSINLAKMAGAALALRPDRRVILTEQGNFPTDLYMLAALGVECRSVPRDALAAALDQDVALLALTHVDYRSGHRHDMAALTNAAHSVGALTLWDLAHSAGAIRCDLGHADADFAVGCGYKFLNGGPGAPAWLYVRRDHQAAATNPLPGWLGHQAPFDFASIYYPAEGIRRFMTGTPPILGLAALDEGLSCFEGVSVDALNYKAGALGDFFIASLEKIYPQLTLASPRHAAARGAHVCFAHSEGYAIVQALIARGVIGDFRAPDLIRIGFAPLTTRFVDVAAAAIALADICLGGDWDDPAYRERKAVT
jgi:kynureninase